MSAAPVLCRAGGPVYVSLIAAGWVLVALADGWAKMQPRQTEPKPAVQRSAP